MSLQMRSILTVTTPADVRALVARDRVKSELSIEGTGIDSLIDDKILDASAAVETYCNRVFAVQTYSENIQLYSDRSRIARHGRGLLMLQVYPVISLASVTENGTALVQDTDYVLDRVVGELTRIDSEGNPIVWPRGTTVVAYTAGYRLPGQTSRDLPRDIEAATLSIVKASYFARRRDPTVKQESVPGVYEAAYWVGGIGDGPLPPDAEGALSRYVQVAMG